MLATKIVFDTTNARKETVESQAFMIKVLWLVTSWPNLERGTERKVNGGSAYDVVTPPPLGLYYRRGRVSQTNLPPLTFWRPGGGSLNPLP